MIPKGEMVRAILTVRRAAEMHPELRKDIATWLRRQATYLEKDASYYAPVFRARYITHGPQK